jgi:asparagine synthase (glutamine-hydrolysing)
LWWPRSEGKPGMHGFKRRLKASPFERQPAFFIDRRVYRLSGFICIMHGDNAPVEQALLDSLTDFLSFRGPDARNTWMDRSIGMGHTLLRTTHESEKEQLPFGLEERYWIVADARLDAREELLAGLQHKTQAELLNSPDCELILRAYAAWGETCVDHLRGDFSFAIWDKEHKKLFCARDHFGIKPFYYANIGSLFVLSNTLNCIRRHPAVSAQLNDLAIADFLLFDMIREPGATSFTDIRRLPSAHALVYERSGITVRRYWTLPASDPVHFKRPAGCVEQFQELLDRAVSDRIRTNHVGVLMSGGLDSPSVAASAQRAFRAKGAAREPCAYTEVFEHLIPHEERYYAGLVAEMLGIPIKFSVSDDLGSRKDSDQLESIWPEPVHSPASDGGVHQLRQVAAHNRVALTGFGGDPALSCLLSTHFSQLLRRGLISQGLGDVMRYLAKEGRLSRLYLRTRWQKWFGGKSQIQHYPAWLNQDLERRAGLRERWERIMLAPSPNGSARRTAYEAILDPSWPNLFEGYDPGATGIPLEVRHPFFDLRLVRFLLALPALPWCSDKELLREAARGILPDAVRLRRKSPLLADPLVAFLQQRESIWVDSFEAAPGLGRYVERRRIPKAFGERDAWKAWINLRPLSLNFWLRSKAAAG